jgi:beta-lactamase superfamily II metal-dependent hydrolase
MSTCSRRRGSKHSTRDAFLEATSAEVGAISLGVNRMDIRRTGRRPGFALHVIVLHTDQMGTVEITAQITTRSK